MTQELLPCPFCGARTGYAAPPALGKGRWTVQCDDCRAEGPTSSNNSDAGETEAIAAWNTRTSTEALQAELAEARAEKAKSDAALSLVSGQLDDATEVCRELRARIAALVEVLGELEASIERRWLGETDKKRANAVSPRTEEALDAARTALAMIAAHEGDNQ